MKIPKPIANLIESFERLPGIGPKTAQRLTFYLLHFPQEDIERFADNLKNLKLETKICSICKNVDAIDPCSICSDSRRDATKLIVTSSPLDVYAFEKVGFKGKYHVLHGVINPLDNIGPEELFIKDLIGRLKKSEPIEVILATNTSMEGEATAMYIAKLIRDEGLDDDFVKIFIGAGRNRGAGVGRADREDRGGQTLAI